MPKGIFDRPSAIERFHTKYIEVLVETPTGWTICWLWRDALDRGGYGRLRVGKRQMRAHVFSFEYFVGPVPEGKQLDHFKCKTPACVRPDHLRPATALENIRNGKTHNAIKTHCVNGHEFTPTNTIVHVAKDGYKHRKCRICANESFRRCRRKRMMLEIEASLS